MTLFVPTSAISPKGQISSTTSCRRRERSGCSGVQGPWPHARTWVQPGAENEEVLAYLDDNGFEYMANACIMVRSRVQPAI